MMTRWTPSRFGPWLVLMVAELVFVFTVMLSGVTLAQQPARFVPPAPYRLGLIDSRTVQTRWGLAVEILGVVPGGAADRVGLEAGDVVVSASGRRIQSPDDLRQIMARSNGQLRLAILDVRTGRPVTLWVDLDHAFPGGPIVNPGPFPPVWPGPVPWPVPIPEIPSTQVRGLIRSFPGGGGKPASFAVIDHRGWIWMLDFSARKDLADVARDLTGRNVVATGIPKPSDGPGIPERRTLVVVSLVQQEGKADAAAQNQGGDPFAVEPQPEK